MTNNSPSLNAVVVGCGGFSRNYLPVYRSLPEVRVVACVDADRTAAESMAEFLGTATASDRIEDAVRAEADYAVVSTPNFLHVEHAVALLESGKHVLLQKPLARHLEESRRLRDVVRAHPGQRLGIYMSMLDFGMWWELRNALHENAPLGEVTQVSMRLGHTGGLLWNDQPNVLWRFSKEKTGGGAFIMLGVHYLHFVRWLTGLKIIRVCAQTTNLHCRRIEGEDLCQVQAELDNGALLELSVAWNSQGEHFALYGTGGSLLYLDNEFLRIHGAKAWGTSQFEYTDTRRWQNFAGVVPPALDAPDNPYNQHRMFAAAIKAGEPPAVPMLEGFWDMQITDAVYRSANNGIWVEVNYDN